ncbi:MAG: NADH-quinone oxidoreductase subunit, partial [Bacteroidota bacterium]
PGFSGFFSKDEILAGAFGYNTIVYAVALFTALMTAFYMFRLYIVTFTGKFRGTHDQEHHLHESPKAMTIPLIILSILSIIGGYIGIPEVLGGHHQLATYLSPVIPQIHHQLSHETELILMGLSTLLVVCSITFAWIRFRNFKINQNHNSLASFLENKWYIDELYQFAVVKPIQKASSLFQLILENRIIDGSVNGVGKLVNYGSRQLRLLQSGQVGAYVLLMVIGMLILFVIQFFVS